MPFARSEAGPSAEDGDSAKSASGSAENILRVDAERIDAVLNLVGELIIGKSMLQQTIQEFGRRHPKDPRAAALPTPWDFRRES